MTQPSVWICGIGMITAVGGCTKQTASSARAGISMYQDSSVYNKRFEPMTLALLPDDILPALNDQLADTPQLTSRQMRMLRLAHLALLDVLDSMPDDQRVPLFLAGPEAMPERPPVITGGFLELLAIQADLNIDQENSKIFANGRAGGMLALQSGLHYLSEHPQDYVLIGGVDTYLDLYLLGTLDSEDRVLANGVMDGFCPGEGAAFILLCTDDKKASLQKQPSIKIFQPGIASEPGHRFSQEPYKGDGLANAVSQALQIENRMPIQTVLSSINGENFGAKEWGVTFMRNSALIDPDFRFEHPADCFGDTGAAVGPILIGLASIGLGKNYLQGPILTVCSSEGELRGAVCLDTIN